MQYLKRMAVAAALTFGIPAGAMATPYANAINVVTAIALTTGTGGALDVVGTPPTTGTSAAIFGASGTSLILPGVVGSTTDVLQSTAGPGPFPGENIFTP